jgi:tetratricopeptide (TPR) repeat protein/predicted phosphodiesterase
MKARWLHISDFHFAGGDPYDRNVVLNALVASLRRFQDQGHGADLVFATGDIAQKGQASEYAAATDFFDAVLKELGLGRERLFVVPGNHDVDREEGVGLLRSLDSGESADKYFQPDRAKHHITSKQAAFLAWYNGYFDGIRRFPERTTCGPVETVDLPDGRVGVLPINSALFCQGDDDHGKLWVGRRCLEEALAALKAQKPDLSVALLHHPLDWLHDEEGTNIKAALERDVDLILRGHLHRSDAAASLGVAGEALHIAAGATYQKRKWPNRAFFARVEGGQVELFPIRYEDSPQEAWTLDTSLFPGPGYRRSFPIPRLSTPTSPPPSPPPPPPPPPSSSAPRTNIPALRKLTLVGRDGLLAQVGAALGAPERDSVLVLRGAPGVGKSELAREYARRNAHRYPGGAFVVEAGGRAIAVGLAEIGRAHLDMSFPPDLPLDDQGVRVARALRAAPCLLIFDNVVAVDDILPWLPPAGTPGHTLLTSLLDSWGAVAPDLVVEPLPDVDALTLVEQLAGAEIARSHGAALLRQAGGLPVQLVPASATLKKEAERGRLDVVGLSLEPSTERSFGGVYQLLEPSAQLLLHAAARLESQAIASAALAEHLTAGANWTEALFRHHLTACLDLHLLDGAASLRMHQLFAAFLNAHPVAPALTDSFQRVVAAQARALVAAARDVATQPNRADLAARLFLFQPDAARWTVPGASLTVDDALKVGRALYEIGRFEEALAWHMWAVENADQEASDDSVGHERKGAGLHNVGACLSRLGRYAAAQDWFGRAVAEKEQGDVHGRVDHASLGVSLQAVGMCLFHLGRYAAAQGSFERAVAETEQGDVRGRVDHESLGKSLHVVGMCLLGLGQPAAAQDWFERAVAEMERGDVHGRVDHENLGRSLHQVGICLLNLGQPAAAQDWFERAVAETERGDVHGRVDHENLGRSLHQVGICLLNLGQPAAAQEWFERVVAEKEQGDVHGRVDHASLGVSLHEVGNCLFRLGQPAAAQEWFERAVAEKEQGDVHGRVNHQSLAISLKAVGVCLSKLDRPDEAQVWFARAAAETAIPNEPGVG